MRRKPGKHHLDRAWPQFLWREDINASSPTLLEQARARHLRGPRNEGGAVTSSGPISTRKGTPQVSANAR